VKLRTYHTPPGTWSVSGLLRRPVALVRPGVLAVAARWFQDNFKGNVLYAVKANPSPWVIRAPGRTGASASFDVASVPEIELVAEARAPAPAWPSCTR